MAGLSGIISGGLGLAGSLMGGNEADRDRGYIQGLSNQLANVQFNPYNVSGWGGSGVSFNNGQAQFNYGGYAPLQQQMLNAAMSGFGQAPYAGQQANALTGQIGQYASNMLQNPFAQQFTQDQLSAAGALGERLQGGMQGYYGNTLDLLRQQAQPFEERQFSNLQDNLFSTGRIGSTGGALQTEAFARGLGQADLQRQLQAGQEARASYASDLAGMQQFTQGGLGAGQLSNQMLNTALSQFQQFAPLGMQLQGGAQALGMQGLTGMDMLFQQLLSQGQFGMNLGTNQANTSINALTGALGGANSMAQLAGSGTMGGSWLTNAAPGIGKMIGGWF